jgi:hypothetical protein
MVCAIGVNPCGLLAHVKPARKNVPGRMCQGENVPGRECAWHNVPGRDGGHRDRVMAPTKLRLFIFRVVAHMSGNWRASGAAPVEAPRRVAQTWCIRLQAEPSGSSSRASFHYEGSTKTSRRARMALRYTSNMACRRAVTRAALRLSRHGSGRRCISSVVRAAMTGRPRPSAHHRAPLGNLAYLS